MVYACLVWKIAQSFWSLHILESSAILIALSTRVEKLSTVFLFVIRNTIPTWLDCCEN